MFCFVLPLIALAATATAHCEIKHLKEAADAYLNTQKAGQTGIDAFKSRFENKTWLGYFENSQKIDINTGILTKPLNITHTRSLYDLSSCATYTEAVVNSTTDPYVIGTQLRFTNHAINRVDSIVTKPGDWLFNITGYAYWVTQEDWSEIPEAKRDTREVIRAAADAYCDLFNNPNVTVPWGTPCVRLEGGLYGDPGPNGTCVGGVPSGVPMTRRRYVIDETVGSVDVMLDFGNSKWPDTHQFRVEGGKIRYVHTMTHCGVANCGLGNGTMAFRKWK
jgi:hypothetical protein